MSDETRISQGSFTANSGHRRAETVTALRPGDLVVNSYRIEREVARGGMGALYEGRHDITNARVAIKAVLEQHAGDERAIKLFEREAIALSRVSHEAIVGYRDILRDDSHRLFIIMDFVDGEPLSAYAGKATLPAEGVEALGKRLSAGLAAAHAAGVAHRDISPKNILLPGGAIERAIIIDFGIAKNLGADGGTVIGDSFAGTIRYAAPEQLGLFGGEVDQRADIYSLGLVLAEVAGAKLDLSGPIGEAAVKRQRDLELPEDMAPRLRAKLERMLRADPKNRPASMAEAWSDGVDADESDNAFSAPPPKSEMVANKVIAELEEDTDVDRPIRTNSGTGRPQSKGLLVGVAVLALLLIGAGAWMYLGDSNGLVGRGSGPALSQAETASEIIAREGATAAEKFAAAEALLAEGGEDNLNVAMAVFRALSSEGDGAASARVARMYDPEFYSADTSPFSKASATSALRWYRKAAEQGFQDADQRIRILEAQ